MKENKNSLLLSFWFGFVFQYMTMGTRATKIKINGLQTKSIDLKNIIYTINKDKWTTN